MFLPAALRSPYYRLRVLLLTWMATVLAACSSGGYSNVVIDAGHGGHDRGASSGGIHEKHLCLDIATRVSQILRRKGMAVTMTRTTDRYLTLGQRVQIADRTSDCAFVSIHINSAGSHAAGIETYHYGGASRISRELASAVQTRLIRATGATNRGVKTANFYVIRRTKRPAILVECGFVSNGEERRRMLDPRYRQRLAQAIADGILAERR